MNYNKYRAKKTVVDGITFDSKKEATRYQELKLLEKAGQIKALVLQVPYDLMVNGCKVGIYRADFTYWDVVKDEAIIEDVKGFKTPVYNIKKKILKAYGIDIYET